MTAETIQLLDPAQAKAAAKRTAEVFNSGGLVVFPTETVYGVGASVTSAKGYEALRRLKQRPDDHPFAVHLATPSAAERYIDLNSPRLARLARKILPGPVTLVVDVDEEVIHRRLRSLGLGAEGRDRIYWGNTVGLRCPDHPLARQILGSIDGPVVASSANRRGGAPPRDASEAAAALGDDVDLLVDGGPCHYAKPSTVIRVAGFGSEAQIAVKRVGVHDEQFIDRLLQWTMLVVCTGNTCRSAMAGGIAKHILAGERGVSPKELESTGVTVLSAGVAASNGQPASTEAVAAMQKMGIDLTRHRSRRLTPEMLHEADVVYCMTESHRLTVLSLSESARDKTFLLDPVGDIGDPIGSGPTTYQRCAELIRRQLVQRLKEQQP